MKIVHRANACFSIFYKDLHILLDPWMNGPAVAQGWTPYPPATSRIEDLPKPDLVYISHIHSDHCEPETMAKIDRDTPILIMNLGPNFLKKMLISQGFKNIIMLEAGELKEVEGFEGIKAEGFGASFGHICANVIDSGVIFQFDNITLLNSNDNKPSEELCRYLKDKFSHIDLALIPGGGGSGYPAMYENLDQAEKEEIVKKHVNDYKKIFSKAVDILKPKVTIPVAGGFAIRGPHAQTVNWLQIRSLDHGDIISFHQENGTYKEAKILPVQPGVEIDVEQGGYVGKGYIPWTKEQQENFFRELSQIKIEPKVKLKGEAPALLKLLKIARKNLWVKQSELQMTPKYRIYFDVFDIDKIYELDFETDQITEITKSNELIQPMLKMKLDQNTLFEWLLGYEDFNMLDSGHRILFSRVPNTYVVEAYYLMSLFRI